MDIKSIIANNPLIKNMVDKKEVVWINPKEINYTEYEKNLPNVLLLLSKKFFQKQKKQMESLSLL